MNPKSQNCKSPPPTHRVDQEAKLPLLPKEQRDPINKLLLDGLLIPPSSASWPSKAFHSTAKTSRIGTNSAFISSAE
jgi:hypothetical protein